MDMERDPRRLAGRSFDLVVVGAGIHGICIAWDASQRGLQVALVDRGDFCGETSSNSLKIVHGGLRYLQQADFGRMRRSIRERKTALKIAPHLVRPLPCVMPTSRARLRGRFVLRCALALNDVMSLDRNWGLTRDRHLPRGRIIGADECRRAFPDLAMPHLTGGALWYDAIAVNTERMALAWLHKATEAGAEAVNYFDVTGFVVEQNQVVGVRGSDRCDGSAIQIGARCVVSTAGPGLADSLQLPDLNLEVRLPHVTAVNAIVRRRLVAEHALAVGRGTDRLLFLVPWRGRTMIGTAYASESGTPRDHGTTERCVAELLARTNELCPSAELGMEDVVFVHRGQVPAVSASGAQTIRLSGRPKIIDHARSHKVEGLLSVLGVKWTTSRAIAERAVDRVFRKLGRRSPPCRTSFTPVHGGDCDDLELLVREARDTWALDDGAARGLVGNHGSAFREVLRYHEAQPGTLSGESSVLRSEILHATRHEMAVHLSDVVFRRTDLGSAGPPDDDALQECARLVSSELGWSPQRVSQELAEVQARFRIG